MSLGKLKQLIFRNKNDSLNLQPALGWALNITGAGTSNPTVTNSKNVTSVTRTSTGTYRVVLSRSTVLGNQVNSGYLSVYLNIHSVPSNYNYYAQIVFNSATELDVIIHEVHGSNLVYDLSTNDTLSVCSFLNIGNKLPPL